MVPNSPHQRFCHDDDDYDDDDDEDDYDDAWDNDVVDVAGDGGGAGESAPTTLLPSPLFPTSLMSSAQTLEIIDSE